MATRTFSIAKDAVVVVNPSGTSLGAGKENHLSVGYTSSYKMRSLLQFTTDFSGMYGITSATLKIRATSTPTAHGTKTTANFTIRRCTSSWSEGTRGSEQWWTDNAVEWSNQPSATATGEKVTDWSGTHNAWEYYDITAIVKAWAPTSIPGGGNEANYGIQLRMQSEASGNYVEFYDRYYGSYEAQIDIVYSDTPPQTNPTVTLVKPTNNTLARIYNLAAWPTTDPRPEFTFTYTDAEQSMSKYRVYVYDNALGTSLVHDSNDVILSVPTGTNVTYQAAWTPTAGTEYYYKVTVWDSYSTPGSSTSALTNFRVRHGTALFSANVGSGASAINVTVNPTSAAVNTQRKFVYRLAQDASGTGATAWVTSIGSLPAPTVTLDWMQIFVMLTTDVSGTNPQIDNLTVRYTAASGLAFPDKWFVTDSMQSKFALDTSIRRFGSKSLKGDAVSANCSIYATPTSGATLATAAPISVTPNTNYVFTCEVRTNDAPLVFTTDAALLGISIQNEALTAQIAPTIHTPQEEVAEAATEGTYDAVGVALYPEGWQRLRLAFRTGPDDTAIRPRLRYFDDGAANTFWVDGAMLTEGTVAPPWSQGTVAPAGVVAATGVQLDGAAGGILRYRGTDGGVRDLVEGGASGLVLGGDVEINSPVAAVLSIGATSLRSGGSSFPADKATGDRFWRTDLNMEFFYDGTRWVSTTLFTAQDQIGSTAGATIPYTATTPGGVTRVAIPLLGGSDLWMEDAVCTFWVSTGSALSASHNWVAVWTKQPATTTLATVTIDSGSSSVWRTSTVAIDALLGSNVMADALWTKTGTPGNLYVMTAFTYRIVAT